MPPASTLEIESLARRIDFSPLEGSTVLMTGSQGMIGNYTAQIILASSQLQGNSPDRFISIGRKALMAQQSWTADFSIFDHMVMGLDFASSLPTCDFFLHFASPASPLQYGSPSSLWDANLGGALAGISAVPFPRRTLFLSSGEVYGAGHPDGYSSNRAPQIEPYGPRSSYPNSKLATEYLLQQWSRVVGSDVRVARLFHTFGPGFKKGDGRSFADILWAASLGEPIHLRSDGSAVRTFAYIEDSVAGILTILLSPGPGMVSDVGGVDSISIREFAQLVAEIADVKFSWQAALGHEGAAVLGVPPKPNLDELRSAGWAREVGLPEGVHRTISHIRQSLARDSLGAL